jgi:hypothetical protein
MSADDTPHNVPAVPETISFSYIKSRAFRVIHVDGAIGGPGPRGSLYVSVFSERLPIPQEQTYRLTDGSQLGDEIVDERKTRKGIVREVEAALVIDLQTAKNLLQWLAKNIAIVERLKDEVRSEEAKSSETKRSESDK